MSNLSPVGSRLRTRRPESVSTMDEEEEAGDSSAFHCSCVSCAALVASLTRPVEVGAIQRNRSRAYDDDEIPNTFCLWPLFGPLLFDNESSDCRDHCANERTFLSYLRLSVYMAIVSVAIILSFHLKKTATEIELRMAKPLGVIFSALAVSCLGVGVANYVGTLASFIDYSDLHPSSHISDNPAPRANLETHGTETVNKFSRRAALVQTGWKTQMVMAIIALCIVASCITLLVVNKWNEQADA
ncbi:hypothetical protein B0T22DRAFT_156392 [Podospora appendiculata]|uniref:DUF202 domain-containing protein n=1 Tax=Podospora appendiculata TaxID=314037 RepID=A0AAE0X9W7_9PEZI|nr:hypothetical protein B0T22DRAFT_156392 [Podospora appendiculata]